MSYDAFIGRMLEATAARDGGDTGRALRLLEDALDHAGDDAVQRIPALIQKAGWLRETGAAPEALNALDAAAEELSRLPAERHDGEWASIRMEQALQARDRGDLATAERLLIEGEALGERSVARELIVPDMRANRAGLYIDQGRYNEAQDLLLLAIEEDRRIGNTRSVSNDLNMLGLLYRELGDDETARAYLTEAFEVAREDGLMHEAMEATSNLGALLDDAGDHAAAAAVFRQLGNVAEAGSDPSSLACSVANQGVAAAHAGQAEQALALFQRSRELHLEVGNRLHAVQDDINLSSVESDLGHGDQALAYAERALVAAREHGLISVLWTAEYRVASCRVGLTAAGGSGRLEDYEAALAGYRRAADIVELLRTNVDRPEEREALLSGKEGIYGEAITVSLALGRARDAFELCERARMRSFLDALGLERLERLAAGDPGAAERRRLVARLLDPSAPPEEKPGLLDQLRRVRAELLARRPAVAAVTEIELPSVDDIRAAIPTDAHVLEFFAVGNVVVQFLIGPEGLKDCAMITMEQPLEDVVERFRMEIEGSDPELETGNVLFAALLRPMMHQLGQCTKLIVVPHGSLHYVPFSALWFVPTGRNAPPRQYLKTRFHLTTVPSASYLPYLARATENAPPTGAPVVLGNPTGDLAGAEEEARHVAARLGVRAALREQATRSALLLAEAPSVLHVAGHGVYNEQDPLLSGIALADGFVTVEDLLDSGPAPSLFVLSGCLTGLSKRRPGDELTGLAQAALRRGTRSVVATLWETFDESGALLFEHFYDALGEGSTVCEALTYAREMVATAPGGFDQPVDWAPFMLIGDPDTRVAGLGATPMPLLDRAEQLASQGDLAGAGAAFRAAMEAGGPREAAIAAFRLGSLLEGQGDREAGLDAYRRALDSGNKAIGPWAMSALARLIEPTDVELAKALYRQAIDSGHRDAGPNAALDLGNMLARKGDGAGALEAFRLAMHSAHPSASAAGAFNVGALLSQAGDLRGARAAYERAAAGGDKNLARAAAAYLQGLPS